MKSIIIINERIVIREIIPKLNQSLLLMKSIIAIINFYKYFLSSLVFIAFYYSVCMRKTNDKLLVSLNSYLLFCHMVACLSIPAILLNML